MDASPEGSAGRPARSDLRDDFGAAGGVAPVNDHVGAVTGQLQRDLAGTSQSGNNRPSRPVSAPASGTGFGHRLRAPDGSAYDAVTKDMGAAVWPRRPVARTPLIALTPHEADTNVII